MKSIKRIVNIILIFTLLLTMVGCTPNMKAYINASKEMTNWKGSTTQGNMIFEMNIKAPKGEQRPIHVKIPITIKGKTQGPEKNYAELTFHLKEAKKELLKSSKDKFNIPKQDEFTIKTFAKDGQFCISKNYFQALGFDVSSIKEEYIQLPMGLDAIGPNPIGISNISYLQSAQYQADIISLMEKATDKITLKNDIQVKDNTFTYEASLEDMIDDIGSVVENVVTNWNDISPDLFSILTNMGFKDVKDEWKEGPKDFNKDAFNKSKNEIKENIKGSTCRLKTRIEKEYADQELALTFHVKDVGQWNITSKGTTKKDDTVTISWPTSIKVLTEKDFQDILLKNVEPILLLRVEGKVIPFEHELPVIVRDRTLIPFRGFLEAIDATDITWNGRKRQVQATKGNQKILLTIDQKRAQINEKEVLLDVAPMLIKDRTMVPARFIAEQFGYKVKYEKVDSMLSIVDIYTGSEEELQEKIKNSDV